MFKGLTKAYRQEIESLLVSYASIGLVGHVSDSEKNQIEELRQLTKITTVSLIFQYPFQKTIFNIAGIPLKVKESLNEAERCFSFGAKNGTAACLRKCIYAICDNREAKGTDYSEKIEGLFPPKNEFSDLAKQIKWLGDNHMHNVNEEKYTNEHIEKALGVMLLIIREIYGNDEKVKEIKDFLNQGYQKTKDKSGN